jgi:transcription initiation factor TFIIB
MLNNGPEWRAYTQEERESKVRVGNPILYSMHDKGLSTTIQQIDRDFYGRQLPVSTRLQMWRLKKWQIRLRVNSSIERNLAQAMMKLDRLSEKLKISKSIKEKAAIIYRKALDKGLVRGRSINGITFASLYAACRLAEIPRTLGEIAEASMIDKKQIARCFRLLIHELDIQMPISDPLNFVSKIAGKMMIKEEIVGLAIKILNEARKKRFIAGKDPMGLAAAALYIASIRRNIKTTQKEIAKAANVTEVTLRNRYKTLKMQLGINMPN